MSVGAAGVAGIITCDFVSPSGCVTSYTAPTSQLSHRSVPIHPALAALPRGASPMPSLPSHAPITLSFPVQATSAETYPLRCANSFPATGLPAEVIYLQEPLIPEALGPKAIGKG